METHSLQMEWNVESEDLITGYISTATDRSKIHDEKGKRNKLLHILASTPGIAIPIIVGGLETHINPLVASILLIASGVISGINSFMNFSNRSRDHFEAASKYDEFSNDTRRVLVMTPEFRTPCDVTLMETTNIINRYLSESPPI